jgi:hypothetical protein
LFHQLIICSECLLTYLGVSGFKRIKQTLGVVIAGSFFHKGVSAKRFIRKNRYDIRVGKRRHIPAIVIVK